MKKKAQQASLETTLAAVAGFSALAVSVACCVGGDGLTAGNLASLHVSDDSAGAHLSVVVVISNYFKCFRFLYYWLVLDWGGGGGSRFFFPL